MNIKRIIFWVCFVAVLALIIWGLIVAMHKESTGGLSLGTPMAERATDHVRGSDTATVTLMEYADFQCPACGAFYPIVERLLTNSSTTVRFVGRHFPLAQHRNAIAAAQAAEAAGAQGKYWDMAGLLYDNQTSWETLTASQAYDVFKGYAERLKLNVALFEADFKSTETKTKIDEDLADGRAIGVSGTPTFFINGKAITNPRDYESFKKLIDEAITSSTP
ncbi:MAG: thioredoxin domain-containing protein [Patescibacteria group bacterium]